MTKFLVVNDPHLTDRPPLGRQEGYADQVFDKLQECWDIAGSEHCDFILFTGDLHHRFRGPVVAYAMTIRLLALLKQAPCPVYGIAGNHDLSSDGTASIWRMPFGVLAKAGALTWLDQARVVEDVLLIPRNWEPHIDAVPTAFKLSRDEALMLPERGEGYSVMVAHASILAPGDTRPYPYHDAEKLPTDVLDVLICGHIHEDEGIHQLSSGCWFANVGSISRISRTADNLTRKPQVLTVTFDKGEIEFERHILKSALPAAEVFFEKEVAEERQVGDFAAALATALEMEETPLDELIAQHTEGQPPEVVERLRRYLMEAENE